MAEDWAERVAKKVESRLAEEAEKAATLRKRFEAGSERFRTQVLDLVAAVNAHIESEKDRILVIALEDGLILAAAYKRIVAEQRMEVVQGVPACVGKVVLHYENRRAATPPQPQEVFLTAAGTQTAFYHQVGRDLKVMGEADFKQIVEYFAT